MYVEKSPRKRCAVAVKDGTSILFVVLARPLPPPPPKEPELLMFFEKPSSPVAKQPEPATGNEVEWQKWSAGSYCVPLVVDERGEIQRYDKLCHREFPNLRDAYRQCGPFESFVEFAALFGCLRLDRMYFLVATKVEEAAVLPFGGAILRVGGTEWISFGIPGSEPLYLTSGDRNRLKEFETYSHEGGYYYSDDCDLRRPFPFVSSKDGNGPQFHSDWSRQLRKPFITAGVESCCSVLLRGFAAEKEVLLKDGSILHVLLCGRQNNLNPGPRYFGRGLNAVNAVGNDHVYEYVMWRQGGGNGPIQFAKHTILRGTVPVHWSTRISKTISEPAMMFSQNKEEVLRGCDSYFSFVFTQLVAIMRYDSGEQLTGRGPRLRCVNMLRQSHHSSEEALTKHFTEAVTKSQAALQQAFPGSQLDLVHVDWLNMLKEQGIDRTTTTFWTTLLATFSTDELVTAGTIGVDGGVTLNSCQTSFVRVNCADSLDRTNIGCFYTCFQSTLNMLAYLRLEPDSFVDQNRLPPLEEQEGERPLETTLAMLQLSGSPRRDSVATWQEACNPSLYPAAIGRALSELYVYNGDTIARLYTNSAAMHSNILRGICGLKAAASNMVIATQRRYENAFEDKSKFRNIELLLGRNIDIHFPSMSQAFLKRPVPVENWGCALIAKGIPVGVPCSEIEQAVRKAWDSLVVPRLREDGIPVTSSDALTFIISAEDNEGEYHDEFICAVKQLTFEQDTSGEEDTNAEQNSEHLAVIEFDKDFCRALDAPFLLQENAILKFQTTGVALEPYTYPVLSENGNSRGIVRKAAKSLRSGVKNFVRGLYK
ncbi:synaptojanin (N-terminal domain) [Trypanosoma brucei equiperdum]|uniref:Synaptojanin (N-terminal domain) n=1 Tax=Trypanosoma brucei equiperdum TaxID=630700 RepID=A0A3L6L3L5_9TRYP|nr:synaptojanin (N-terminal domain) [Trypanosoma brucei equiperdum]